MIPRATRHPIALTTMAMASLADYVRTYTYTYDTNGNLTSKIFDYGGDGIADYIEISTYDANGKLIFPNLA
ncbi:hypothetical protein [Nostoc sp. CHAB 5715]|uniref:hypothetical protein n=1 Tax=Nostoc sp. CHAB 5715 TaxID=2780400 RepID=UPI001E31FFF0|nr:hypothetical protein [Nostoc sp. CHAB 5715]MCC5620204.1 hypothetical protein [Nostoc sp. CHAB 5715]